MAEEIITGTDIPQEAEPIAEKKNTTERKFNLSDGSECVIRKGKGREVMQATRVADGDGSKFLYAMIAQVTTIGGSHIVMEDLDEISMGDLLKIQGEFTEINF